MLSISGWDVQRARGVCMALLCLAELMGPDQIPFWIVFCVADLAWYAVAAYSEK